MKNKDGNPSFLLTDGNTSAIMALDEMQNHLYGFIIQDGFPSVNRFLERVNQIEGEQKETGIGNGQSLHGFKGFGSCRQSSPAHAEQCHNRAEFTPRHHWQDCKGPECACGTDS